MLEAAVATALSQLPVKPTAWVLAFSGGLDSSVLLHLLQQLQQQSNHWPPLEVIHVHHGLSPHADAWQQHCAKVCASLQLPYQAIYVQAQPKPRQSLEAIARKLRYQALAEVLKPGACLLTAHHQDDQAETLLLQLMRGAGPKGLAAMPPYKAFAAGYLLRPLLPISRQQLQAYAQNQQLSWVDDESNSQSHFARNYLRLHIMPKLKHYWPSLNRVLTRSAELCAETTELLQQIAAEDLRNIQLQPQVLAIDKLKLLSIERQHNVLRYWFEQWQVSLPSQAVVRQIDQTLLQAPADANPHINLAGKVLRRYRQQLWLLANSSQQSYPCQQPYPFKQPLPESLTWTLAPLPLPWLGLELQALPKPQGLRPLTTQEQKLLQIRFRQGGERFKPAGRQETHSLKKLFQAWGVPPWQRQQIPLLYCGEELICVVGYDYAEAYKAKGAGAWLPELVNRVPLSDGL